MARRSTGRHKKNGNDGFFYEWAKATRFEAKRKLLNAKYRLKDQANKHYWDMVEWKRRQALWQGAKLATKLVGKGIKEVAKATKNLTKEGVKAIGKGAKSVNRISKKIGKRINDATKPVRDAIKTQQDRRKRRKEVERKARDKAREDFNRKERLKTRSNAAPDGIKTKDTKSAVKDAVQRAKKTTTTVSKHNRSKNGKTHEVGEHDRKLNPQEQNRQVADDLLKQSKSKPVPRSKKKSAKSNVIDLEIEKQRKKNRELGKQAREIRQDTDRIKGKAPKLTGDEDKDFPAFQRRMKNLSDDLSQEKQNDIVRRLKDQMDNTKDSQQSKPGRNINTNGGNYERVDNDGFHVEGKSKDSKPKQDKSGGSKPTEYREINNNGIYINRDSE